jgi:hypothetical protein
MNCVVITDISCHETMKNSSEPFELSASLEDYIEAIYHIVEEKLVARSKDIAARLGSAVPR